ncbi:MAG TPA: DegV family protein [Candidatus Onthovivens sp.]|nr:DegV family protein [Candidatus Onthovivens sp.]
MKYKIVCDSSSNLTSDYLKSEKDIAFGIAPLSIYVKGKEFVDDDHIDVNKLLDEVNATSEKSTSSCPSPQDFINNFEGAEEVFCFTITSKLSGAYNSACLAKELMKDRNEKVFVLDSKLVAGTIEQLVIKCVELIKEGLAYEEICQKLEEYRDSLKLFFALDKFDNLVKNGRMSKITALIAQMIAIKPLCYGDNGEIKIKEKIRTFKGVLVRLAYNIEKYGIDFSSQICIISHTRNAEGAQKLKELIEATTKFKEIIIRENRGLCAFYSLDGGILCAF